jgi:hypothetical protein
MVGPNGQSVPIDITRLSPSKVIALTSHDGILSEEAHFESGKPTAASNYAKRLRDSFNDALGEKLPDVQRLRKEESGLIDARDAARQNMTLVLNDKYRMISGVIYGNIKYIPLWLALKAMGAGFGEATGAIVMLKAIMENASSRTLRAALYTRIANIVDSVIQRQGGQGGAAAPSAGQTAIQPKTPLQSPPVQGLTAAQGPQASPQGGVVPPVIPATFVTNMRPMTRGTELPAAATRARAGSGDNIKGITSTDKSVAQRTTSSTKIASEAVGKDKAMLDRLDDLLSRKPKNAMENAAIQREIKELKALLAGKDVGTKHAGTPKRIADRERLAAKRAEEAVKQPAAGAPPPGGVTPAMNPEQRVTQLDLGYKALAKFDGGPEMAKALKTAAKQLSKVDPSYDELEQLKQSLKVLIDAGERPMDEVQ